MKIYNCLKVTVFPPKNFISYNSREGYKSSFVIDGCLASEILSLWQLGIKTTGCCCGHGKVLGYIGVTDDCIESMEKLGYQHYLFEDKFGGIERKDAFIPKSNQHIFDGFADGFQG